MPRGRGAKQFFNFVKGWNTEASPLTFPENTAKDLDNVILDTDGSVRRRPGADFEANFGTFGTTSPTDVSRWGLSFHEWLNVAGSGSTSFTVTQVGLTLYVHRQNGTATSNTLIGSVDITSLAVNVAEAKNSTIQTTEGLGFLFCTGRWVDPFYLEYDGTNLTATKISIDIRDFDGLPDGLRTTERISVIPISKAYNLLNQGWTLDRINSFASVNWTGTIEEMVVVELAASPEVFPSNADISHLGMKVDSNGDLVFDKNELINQTFGSTPAPKGRFIINAFEQDRQSASGIVAALQSFTIPTRPETVAFHNGRVFYAGIFTQGETGNVYFSQQLTDIDKAGKCYQEQDPTAEDFNDLLATDGGFIPVPDAGQIFKLVESKNGVLIFASNGVWEIVGSDGRFSATNLAVRKITDVGCIGAETVLNADGTYLYWSDAGIIALVADQVSGELTERNISKNTIQLGYLLIGGVQRKFARGAYITEEKKAVWLYSTDSDYDGIVNRWKCNGALVLDTQMGAFYKYTVSDITGQNHPYMAGIIKTVPFISDVVQENVTENGVVVTENGVNVTVASEGFGGADISSWKLLVVKDTDPVSSNLAFSMGEFASSSWHDWFKQDGIGANYVSFLETGYDLYGSAMTDMQPTFVYTYFSPLSKSLQTGGYYELPPLITFTEGVRTTQCVRETLETPPADMRVTQCVRETIETPDSNMRVTQVVRETLFTP